MLGNQRSALRAAATADQLEKVSLPAPTGGINAVEPGRELGPRDMLYGWNVIASEQGLRARTGWREWATGLTGTITNEVRCTIPFSGSTVANARLFQTTDKGIWNVSTATPTLALTFTTPTPLSGWGVAVAVTTAGGHFLLYADEVNGLHYYSEATGLWAAYTTGGGTGQITGVDPARVASVTVWKNRVWLTEKETAKAYYLDVGAVFGTATAFNFGQRFAHGGSLIGLFNWSVNAGDGLDTQLVGISTGGDVVIYVGTDPTSATTFALRGVWYVGAVPAGRTIATDIGGDLLIASAVGLVPLSRLVLGDPDKMQYTTAKISSLFSRLANTALGNRGWAIHTHPTDNAMMVLVPETPGGATSPLVCSLSTRGWSRYRDVPILSAAVWEGEMYFGTADGRCCRHVGSVDNVLLATPSTGDAIQWSILMAYRGDIRQKQVQGVRPILLSDDSAPACEVTVRYNFDMSEPGEPAEPPASPGSWDYGVVKGTLALDAPMSSTELAVTLTTTPTFPNTEGAVVISGGDLERVVYISLSGTAPILLSCPDPTVSDHFAGETVTLVTAPDDETGTWDVATWGGEPLPTANLRGAVGMGRDVALAIRGASYSRTTLVGVDVLFTVGGTL